ncbi:hypothetical protein H5410_041140 [Solanum commersonii]|uniref:Uncharacterized protein n=1 Tax=Solanum commersonii TaxID=4109 RepID=A0A9J5XS66_SOLCO|nr:hypothetical protein H5410_041140 [Solanum commersonii]
MLRETKPVFDQTPKVRLYPSTYSSDTDEDNVPLRWALQRRMVPSPQREKKRKRRSGDVVFELPTDDVVDVSIEVPEEESVGEDSPLEAVKRVNAKQVKKNGEGRSRKPVVKKGDPTKGKGNDSQKKEPSKRKRETSPVLKQDCVQGPGTKRSKDDKEMSKQTIVDNLPLEKVLEGRVFDTDILTKPGMDSLSDLVEIQLWTHLFRTKSHVLHEDQVQEFYYNVEFAKNGSIKTRIGNKRLHLDEELLGKILEVPREGIRFVVGKSCTK